jgi:hypothetical protein
MGIHRQVTLAAQTQIHHRMSGEQREHVIEKGNASPDRRPARAIEIEFHDDFGFFGDAVDYDLPAFHAG